MADENAGIHNVRRYYLLKSQVATDECSDLDVTWLAKQQAVTGTDLPSDFPSIEALTAAHYTTEEDLDGATASELVTRVGLNRRQAELVLAALEE